MLLTVAPPVCVAKYSTTKTPEHRHADRKTDKQHGTLKLNSVNAVELENEPALSKHIQVKHQGTDYDETLNECVGG